MNNLDRNWNNLFGEYTTDETAWYGHWTVYSPDLKIISSRRVVRSFRSNSDNTVITHINRYVDTSENAEEKTWQLDRATCNQPDGVVHPAMPFMRALSFGRDAAAWIAPKFVPEKPFGGEFFFREGDQRCSIVIVYGNHGQIDRFVHIREQLGCFSDESASLGSSNIAGCWIGKKLSMTADLEISVEETQISGNQLNSHHKMIALPEGLVLMLPEQISANQSVQITAARTIDQQLQYLAAHYTATGALTLLVSATLQQESES